MAALFEDGLVYTWGWDGVGTGGDRSGNDQIPRLVDFGGEAVTDVVAVETSFCALTASHAVKCWGRGGNGQLGNGGTSDSRAPVNVLSDVRLIAGAKLSACAVEASNPSAWTIKCWGKDDRAIL